MSNKNKYLYKSLLKEDRVRADAAVGESIFSTMRKSPTIGFAILSIVLILVQALSAEGMISSAFVNAIGNTIIYCIVGLGFCLLLGYSALASLGTAGFIGIGAYVAYYGLASGKWGLSIGMTVVVAVLAAVVIGIIVGYVSLRIEGIYLAIVTLGISQIIKEILSAICDTIKLSGRDITLFGNDQLRLKTDDVFIILVAVLFILMVITQNLMNSPTGRAMLAMKNSTSAAQAFGVSLLKYRLLAFVISIIYAALAGVLYMLYVRYVSNSSSTLFTLSKSLNILGAVVIGGTKSIWGTIGGTFIIYGIDSMFLQDIDFFRENPTLITLFCGILVVIVIMFYPGGLAQLMLELKYKLAGLRIKMNEAKYGKDLG